MSGIILTLPYIYKLTLSKDTDSFKKGDVYIGKHSGVKGNYFTSGTLPTNIIGIYGKEVFEREIIVQGDFSESDLNNLEKQYIDEYQCCRPLTGCGLNLTLGGDGVNGAVLQGERNPSKKLYKEQVENILLIYRDCNVNIKDIANTYKVSAQTIHRILSGKTWKHVRSDIDRESLKKKASFRRRNSGLKNANIGRQKRRRFTDDEIVTIRTLFKNGKLTLRELGVEYNVAYGTIADIVYRRSYKNI